MPQHFEHPEDRTEYRRPAHRTGVELYRASILRHQFDPHSHEAYGLGVITAGVGRFRWRGGEHLAPRATLMLMNPDDLHTGRADCWHSDGAWGYRMVYLEPALLQALSGEPAWLFEAAVAGDAASSAEVAGLIAALWTSCNDALAFDSALLGLVDALRRHARMPVPTQGAAQPRFAPVLDFMRAHLGETLTLEQLAGVVGLSPFHFLRSFKAQQHATPQQQLMAMRLAEAKRRLATGEAPAEVAVAVGLSDQAHLGRAFLRRYGLPPGRYQQQLGTRQRQPR